jgi:mono/diheme cytochrome c family protein
MKQTTSNRQAGCAMRQSWLVAVLLAWNSVAGDQPVFEAGGSDRKASDPGALSWDAEFKDYVTKPGERYAQFTFWFTNVSTQEVVIRGARSSCFCTVARLPQQPWSIAPGKGGPIEVTLDLLGKGGTVSKAVTVDTSKGRKTLLVQARVTPAPEHETVASGTTPSLDDGERLKNRQTALADRQAVFKREECASCHAEPARGKSDGVEIYAAVCANCHESPQRASMVPDLRTLRHVTGADHWRKWITEGRAGSMMPAFARGAGGPLDEPQIAALVEHLVKVFPSRTQPGVRMDARAYAETMSVFPLPSLKQP